MKKINSYFHITPFSWITFLVVALSVFSSCKQNKTLSSESINAERRLSLKKEKEVLPAKDKVKFEFYFFNANKEKILGNYEDAAKLYLAALDVYPRSTAAMYELAYILLQKQKTQHALYYSKKAVDLEPDNYWYQYLYVNCLKEMNNWPEVANVYKALIKQEPQKAEYYHELAYAYLKVGKTDNAIEIYDQIESKFGFNSDVVLQKVKVYQSLKKFDKAINETQRLIDQNPYEYNYYGILGDIYQDKGDQKNAFEAYQKMEEMAPDNPYVNLTLADYYRNQKQKDKAFQEIVTAFKSPELDIDTKVKILLSYYYASETFGELKGEADTLCKIITQVHPDDPKSFSIYGDFLYRDEKYAEARTQYKKSIALDKDKYAVWSQLLFIDSQLNDQQALEEDSRQAMELFPLQALPYFFNGVANLQMKNYQKAVLSFEDGKDYVIGNPELLNQFYSYLGDAYNYMKKYKESDAAYEKSLEIKKDNALVLNNYAYYLSLRNENLEKAEQMSKKSNLLEPNNASYQDTYGWVLYKMGKYEDAKTWIKKAIENNGSDNGTLFEHYGDILFKLGEVDTALEYWKKAKKTGDTTEFIDKKIADKKLYE